MRVVVFGARGMLGSRIVSELIRRGHTVRLVVRPGGEGAESPARLPTVIADVTRPASVAHAVRGADVVVSAVGPRGEDSTGVVTDAAKALLTGLRQAGVARLLVVGAAGSLEVEPGVRLSEMAHFPEDRRAVARAHHHALGIYRDAEDLDWTVVSPAAIVEPGARTGHYRAGGDQLLVDANGESRISAEDYAVAVVDEVELPRHIRRRFAVAGS
jgi:uncharacterized protein